VTVKQTTNYPWDGKVVIDISLEGADDCTIHLRIPDWAQNPQILLDGSKLSTPSVRSGSYTPINVKNGARIDITLPMPIERIVSHPHVTCNLGRVALRRGPLIYCIEQADHDVDVWDIALPDDAELTAEHRPELLGGVTVITGEGVCIPPSSTALYSRYSPNDVIVTTQVEITAIPYYAWANRDAGPMQVWMPTLPQWEDVDVDI
jgi:DUF1680 family protein